MLYAQKRDGDREGVAVHREGDVASKRYSSVTLNGMYHTLGFVPSSGSSW